MPDGSRILLVDDDPRQLIALAALLEDRFKTSVVDRCSSPRQALELISKTDFDVVLTDVRMPTMDGLTLLKEMRAVRPDVAIVLVTGLDDGALAVAALRGGAFDFIHKPVDADYLVMSIARAIRSRQIARGLEERQRDLEKHAKELGHIVEDQTRELREANRIKDEFLATLSHELRTPLTAILGWSRLMLGGTLDSDTNKQAIAAIERNATLQARLIEDLLDVSRIMTGKLHLHIREVGLDRVIQASLASARAAAEAKNVRVEYESQPGRSFRVLGDAVRLQQITSNLLSNAVKFTEQGGVVRARLTASEGMIVFRVEDSGVGIAKEFLSQVFERFRQADSSVARSQGGLGLGLAIVKHLVSAHDGAISAESDGLGKGATFTLRLPEMVVETHQRDSIHSDPRESPLDKQILQGIRVLLVEDDDDSRTFLTFTLQELGASVVGVDSVKNALGQIRTGMFDVLLSDIAMPGEDGRFLIKKVRSLESAGMRHLPAAALTAYARADDRDELIGIGFDAHVTKPVDPHLLAETVIDLCGQLSSR